MQTCTNIYMNGTILSANCETGSFYQDPSDQVGLLDVCHRGWWIGLDWIGLHVVCLEVRNEQGEPVPH